MHDVVTCELDDHVALLTLNRIEKHNAFDEVVIRMLQEKLDDVIQNPHVRVVLLRAAGQHFSAGADLSWMQRMAKYTEEENINDAKALARLLTTLHKSPKPTMAAVHGSAFGGGAGLVAACDIAIAAENAHFCFSEVKLGLIPATISPYVVRAVGARTASWLFMSADKINASTALNTGLIHQAVPEEELQSFAHLYAHQIASLAPEAVRASKQLVHDVSGQPINEELLAYTANLIAKKRASKEGQKGLLAFLNKETPVWDE